MATDRMALPEHVRKAMEDGDADLLREGRWRSPARSRGRRSPPSSAPGAASGARGPA